MQEGKSGKDIYCMLEDEPMAGGQLGFGGTGSVIYQ